MVEIVETDPELAATKALFCRPGQAERWRARLDAAGQYGTAVYETPYLPDGTDAIEANLAALRRDSGMPWLFDDVVARGANG